MSKKTKKLLVALVLCTTAACSGGVRQSLGLHGRAPDEFKVVSNAPLAVPPEFTLRPPVPGAKRPQEVDLQQQAKDVLFENNKPGSEYKESKGESIFLKRADTLNADPEIKELLTMEERDAASEKKKKGFFEKLASYASFNKNKEPIVNSGKEKERIENNKKEGKPVNEGETPVMKSGKGGLLNNVFGF